MSFLMLSAITGRIGVTANETCQLNKDSKTAATEAASAELFEWCQPQSWMHQAMVCCSPTIGFTAGDAALLAGPGQPLITVCRHASLTVRVASRVFETLAASRIRCGRSK